MNKRIIGTGIEAIGLLGALFSVIGFEQGRLNGFLLFVCSTLSFFIAAIPFLLQMVWQSQQQVVSIQNTLSTHLNLHQRLRLPASDVQKLMNHPALSVLFDRFGPSCWKPFAQIEHEISLDQALKAHGTSPWALPALTLTLILLFSGFISMVLILIAEFTALGTLGKGLVVAAHGLFSYLSFSFFLGYMAKTQHHFYLQTLHALPHSTLSFDRSISLFQDQTSALDFSRQLLQEWQASLNRSLELQTLVQNDAAFQHLNALVQAIAQDPHSDALLEWAFNFSLQKKAASSSELPPTATLFSALPSVDVTAQIDVAVRRPKA